MTVFHRTVRLVIPECKATNFETLVVSDQDNLPAGLTPLKQRLISFSIGRNNNWIVGSAAAVQFHRSRERLTALEQNLRAGSKRLRVNGIEVFPWSGRATPVVRVVARLGEVNHTRNQIGHLRGIGCNQHQIIDRIRIVLYQPFTAGDGIGVQDFILAADKCEPNVVRRINLGRKKLQRGKRQ